ncbi:hypothetical protein [Anaerofustis sp.]|uniref:hypothetical protein n=1 Tax=Anaerofustis sp. TaxID=1872517 RepID=UPI0025C427A9|nr:hypothetical protein [Anaerofustis sp.]
MLNRDAIEKIEEMAKNEVIECNGFDYSTKQLFRIEPPAIQPLNFKSIKGVCDVIKKEYEKHKTPLIVVADEDSIDVYTHIENRKRDLLYTSVSNAPYHDFGRYITREEMCIKLKSIYIQTEERDNVIKLISSISNSHITTQNDDGFSQSVEVAKGISFKEMINVDSIITLKPYRTFNEVEQPESKFLLRFKEYSNNIGVALFEADGGAWKLDAKNNIMAKLCEELEELIKNNKVIVTI